MGRLVILTLVLAGCVRLDTYRCDDSGDCGAAGVCEPNHFCSFADPACASDRSYGNGAGGLSGVCVGDEPGPDAATIDGAIDASDGAAIDAGIDAPIDALVIDAPADAPEGPTVAHLAPTDSLLGTADWTVAGVVTLDTSALTVDTTLPAGVYLDVASQTTAMSEVAVLHVGDLVVNNSAELRVQGTRPLIIVSTSTSVLGRIDASANAGIHGPGGADPGGGTGQGGDGAHVAPLDDGGGGGAGFGLPGARGGNDGNGAAGGLAGAPYGDPVLTVLQGGSGGGAMVNNAGCAAARAAGAGGGAIQIFAVTSIVVAVGGGIEAGGGGGAGGRATCATNNESGRGGGSGGAIYLQAATITNTGLVAANGGAGGAPSVSLNDGNPGADGALSLIPALGGLVSGNRRGGNGGARGTDATNGTSSGSSDGGGGGGAVGRIVLRSPTIAGEANTSPAAVILDN